MMEGSALQNHICYMLGDEIVNGITGAYVKRPAVLVSKSGDIIHAWGEFEDVEARFNKFAYGYSEANLTDELNDLLLVELSVDKGVTKELACYVMRRAAEYTASGFVKAFCREIVGGNPAGWLKAEMEKFPLDLDEKEMG